MKLLAPELLVKTSDVDHADWNYHPLLSLVQRIRFAKILSLLKDVQCDRMLEIGYGSGVFMPELSRYCKSLTGIDIHNQANAVRLSLRRAGLEVDLEVGSAEQMPFPDSHFDYVVAVSTLEYIIDLEATCLEVRRVLKPGGRLVTVTPGHSKILDIILTVLTGESAENDYGDRRERLLAILMKHFSVEKLIISPPIIGQVIPLYKSIRLRT